MTSWTKQYAMTPTQQVEDLFKPLLGQAAWSVRGGVGSMLTLEFGAPHIIVREPIVARPGRSEKVRRVSPGDGSRS